ncbi:MAG TPA: MFS transporter [Candidatus Acidoferrales bacterium]|jgi:AAHS family 4-hydroxybenzoate transporter-like MFS transporter|nr:MFS transporter [Candidatus Acidoferrales bacterium]
MATTESQTFTVAEIIEHRSLGSYQIWTIVLCGLVLVLDGFDSQAINFIAPSIADSIGIPIRTFGPIFSGGLFGLMIAAMTTGPIADRWGRKWPVLFSTFSFALFSLLTVHVTSFRELLILRFLTGLGLGGAMPNVVALASEYVPKRMVASVVSLLFVGMPLGGVTCGLLSAAIIPKWGWQSVLYLGGAFPLVISILLIARLPESVQFLAVRGKNPQRVSAIMSRIAPEFATANLRASPRDTQHEGVPVKYLFTEGRAFGTILLWIPYFMNLLIIYFITSWLPALLRASGMTIAVGVTATAFFNFGGVFGCLVEGWLIRRRGAYLILLFEFGLATAFIGALSKIPSSFSLMLAVTFILGFMVVAAQSGLNALAASYYPTAVRSTGIGWALGVGRIGSIVGPLVGGMFLSMGWKPAQILLSGTAAAACAWLAIFMSKRMGGRISAYSAAPDVMVH